MPVAELLPQASLWRLPPFFAPPEVDQGSLRRYRLDLAIKAAQHFVALNRQGVKAIVFDYLGILDQLGTGGEVVAFLEAKAIRIVEVPEEFPFYPPRWN